MTNAIHQISMKIAASDCLLALSQGHSLILLNTD